MKGYFTTLSRRNCSCAKIEHETFPPQMKSDDAIVNLITALLQDIWRPRGVSMEPCWKLNPMVIHINCVLGNAISKMYIAPVLDPDLNYESQCQAPSLTEKQACKATPLALGFELTGK